MKKTILFVAFFLLPFSVFAQTGNNTINGIFRTAQDVFQTVQKVGDYVDQVQRSFGELWVVNMTDKYAEFTLTSSSPVDSYDPIILTNGQRDRVKVTLIPSSTNTVQITALVTAWTVIDEKRVYALSGKCENVWFDRGSSQRIKTLILRADNENYWVEIR